MGVISLTVVFRIGGAMSAAFVLLMFLPLLSAKESLTVVSWGGAAQKAHEEGYFRSFEEVTGIEIQITEYNGGLAQIRAQVETGNVHWDLVSVESQDKVIGCDEGLLEVIDDLELPDGSDGTPAEEDYLEGSLSDCSVGTITWSTIIAYNANSFESDPPTTMADFFDVEKYPGKRGIRRIPEANLEFALIADGVSVDKVYDTLSTKEGVDRAFAKLDTIRDYLVIWEAGAQPPQLLADQEVLMTTAYNGRIFNAQTVEKKPFVIIWDGQVRDYGQWVIVAGSPNLQNARRFLQHVALSSSLAGVANRISYGPVRRSAWNLVDKHIPTGIDMRPHMPTHPNNSKNYLTSDAEWWADHKDELTERFSVWLSN
ncbi:MAG: ABC transporter substrate-binding protein [Gammaproteobacteria bacterium]|nr:ABC transporter substrate-binding protein [Gammaproteobacteria bacterium]MDE0252448.1 ABC transporter substrate-binding protein [Gammaproteobacteria bacterium]MDE0402443.1 ABC transporter substrate-binding protein [Gammaproteobacteria bacterium]